MTDNRTTELLREGLTEHGIEWRSGLEGVTFVGYWCFVEYDNGRLAATCEPVLTPEQAIAATLGGGKLTADDVLNAVYKHGARWQAIADELNAALRNNDCEFRPFKDEDWSEPNAVRGVCSECSALMYGKDNYCPNCGRKAVKR